MAHCKYVHLENGVLRQSAKQQVLSMKALVVWLPAF